MPPSMVLFLLLLLLPAVSLAASRPKENKVKDGVGFYFCPAGQYIVNGSCETYPKGTYMDHPNSETVCKPCNLA